MTESMKQSMDEAAYEALLDDYRKVHADSARLHQQLATQAEVIEAARAVSGFLPKWKFAPLRAALDRLDALKAGA